MKDYEPATYGERIADDYDRLHAHMDPAAAVEMLTELARGGRVLELGVGTGRIALPLAARGVAVSGVDASPAMIERLRAKPGGDAIAVHAGDFADVLAPGPFAVIFVAFNTFFALDSQDAQVRCFENAAERLAPGGLFAIEAFVPDVARFDRGQTLRTMSVRPDVVMLEATQHDRNRQHLDAQLIALGATGTRLYPVQLRYAWPSELDLMARLAGLRLRDRWSGWDKQPFGASSAQHVSIYERINSPPARSPDPADPRR